MRNRYKLLCASALTLAFAACSSSSDNSGSAGAAGTAGAAGKAGAGGSGGADNSSGAAGKLGQAGGGNGGSLSAGGDSGAAGDTGSAGEAGSGGGEMKPIAATKRVLLISVDGMHQADLAKFIVAHPDSTLAALAKSGVQYSAARTTTPSDSFPGLLSLVTGGTSKSTGVYYDDSYDRTLYAPGSKCQGSPGTEIVMDESLDYDATQLFSGGINPENLPLQKDGNGNCKPVYPHDFVRVNTVFEVVHEAAGYTAWSDKHPAYDLVNGPSGVGVDDLYTPEINSDIGKGGTFDGVALADTLPLCDGSNSLPVKKVSDYTTCLPAVMAYDDIKVRALLHQIDGKRSDGVTAAPVPTLFGMNFQEVSVGQKLTVGGYTDAAGTPNAQLAGALGHVDESLGKLVAELKKQGLFESTLIIISAKHGQSPIDKSKLHMEAGGSGTTDVEDPLVTVATVDPTVDNAPSTYMNPNSGSNYATHGHLMADDVGLLWLQDQSKTTAVVAALQAKATAIHADTLPAGTVFSVSITSGSALSALFGDPTSADPIAAARAPNAFIQPNLGVIYSGSGKKIAEHGGGTVDDTGVALLVSLPGLASVVTTPVTTTQVAPTILQALGLDAQKLKAVVQEKTTVLPALF